MDNSLDGFVPYVSGTHGKPRSDKLTGKSGAYVIDIEVSGKLYVGSSGELAHRVSTNLNKLKHNKHHNEELQTAYNNNPDATVWVRVTDTVEQAQQLEQELVDKFLPTGNLTNRAIEDVTRPRLGMSMSEEHKKKIIDVNRGRNVSEETRLKLRDALLNKPKSEEHVQNLTTAQRKRFATEEGKAAHALTREKIKKPVECAGVIYPSRNEAAKALGVTAQAITYRCNSDNFPDCFRVNKTI